MIDRRFFFAIITLQYAIWNYKNDSKVITDPKVMIGIAKSLSCDRDLFGGAKKRLFH